MFKLARHITQGVNTATRITLTASQLIGGGVKLLSGLASTAWAHHQELLAERPAYGPQLAALATIVMALIEVPAWVVRLITGLLDLWLSSYDRHSVHRIHGSDWDLDENGSWT